MRTFFIVVAAMFVGGILSLLVLYFGIKFLIKYFLKKLFTAIEKMSGQGVPPFRITLEKADDIEWKKPKIVSGVATALEGVGYRPIGDYRIDEMPFVHLRALLNSNTNSYAVVTEIMDKLILDVASDFTDGEHVTVSTAPETGLDRPDFSRLVRITADLEKEPAAAVTLHDRLVEEQRGRQTIMATPVAFPNVFSKAHAKEMDWRIARDGLTPEEVRRSCEVTGTEIPSDEAVEMVCQQWRNAISEFCDEQLRDRFLKYVTKMSAAEWEEVRDRLYFVHEHSDRESVIEALALQLEEVDGSADTDDDDDDDDDTSEVVQARIRPLFAGVPVREAFVTAQDLLPAKQRYRRVASIKTPYAADVYVEPESSNGMHDD
jgi:hypothetical protein